MDSPGAVSKAGEKKKRVLIVGSAFPPANVNSALRLGKLAKYLPAFGWEPIVLTMDHGAMFPRTLAVEMDEANVVRARHFYLDPAVAVASRLASHGTPPSAVTSKKTTRWTGIVHRLLSPIDRVARKAIGQLPVLDDLLSEPAGWYFYAVKAGLRILSERDVDAIFSSSPSKICHVVASRLHRKTGVPWVAEYRDLWVDPYLNRSRLRNYFDRSVEKAVMKGCDSLVTVSELTEEQLRSTHSRKVVTIPNGFDEDDYREDVPLTARFTLTYAGSIYPGKRDPTTLFQALAELKEEGRLSPDSFEVRFYGLDSVKTILPMIEDHRLEEFVKVHGFVPFRESVNKLKESTALLLLEWDSPLAKHVPTGKVFAYFGAQRPILAIAYKSGAIDNLLQETGTGILVNEPEAIKDVLSRWLEEWRRSGRITSHWNPDLNAVRRYTRREQTRKLAQLLEEVSGLGVA